MLQDADNQAVSRVGPGTPMGTLFREYWLPALLSSELANPDSEPVRVLLLGEQLIAFRDTSGKVGLVGNLCPHRGASLFFGRNEENGLRCVYHGWKFDVTGQCVDMPNEPAESNFKNRIKATAYPCEERGGVVWAYMGERAVPPALPDFEANADGTSASAIIRDCNWLQALEGDIDTSHQGFLHHGVLREEDMPDGTFFKYITKDRSPRYVAVDTDYGSMYGAYRPGPPGQLYWRIAQFLFPCYTHIPSGVLGLQVLTRAWVPMDDGHTMYYSMAAGRGGDGRLQMKENSTDWYGRFRLLQAAENDYLIDREVQRTHGTYTGIEGIHVQDQAVTESMGSILDREREHLGSSDSMVIRVRRRLLESARALVDHKVVPPGVDDPTVYRTRAGGTFLDEHADWLAATEELRRAYVDHPELDASIIRG